MKGRAVLAVVVLAAVALAAAGGSAALPGNGRVVLWHPGGYWLANPDGTDPQPLVSAPEFGNAVAWSPDGSHLAFRAYDGGDFHVYVVAADGSDLTAILDNEPGRYFPVCWLPSGLIVMGAGNATLLDLFLVRPDGTGLRRLSTDGVWKSVSRQGCAADGSRVAYHIDSYPQTAYWVPTDGGEPTRITPEGWSDSAPTLSPDGRYAALTRQRQTERGVSVLRVDLATGATIGLSASRPDEADALWSPDGTQLLLSARRYLSFGQFPDVVGELSLLAADGSSERRLSRPTSPLTAENPYDFLASWSPDGERIIFEEGIEGFGQKTRIMNGDGGCRTTTATRPIAFVQGGWQPLPGVPAAAPIECVDVRVEGKADRAVVTMGELFMLRVRVENQGTLPAAQVTVNGAEGAHLRRVSISETSGSCSPARMRCELGTLQPGETVEVNVGLRSTFARPATGSTAVTYRVEATAGSEFNPDDNSQTMAVQAWACTQLASPAGSLVTGTARADILCGHVGADRVIGRSGNDIVSARSGNDRVEGGPGRDRLDGGAGSDTLLGGSGRDAMLAADGARDVVDCCPGEDAAVADRIDRLRRCEHIRRR